MRREILAMVIHCASKDDGCISKGEVRHLEVTYTEYISKHRGRLKID